MLQNRTDAGERYRGKKRPPNLWPRKKPNCVGPFEIFENWYTSCDVSVTGHSVTGHCIARFDVHLGENNMISRVQFSAFTLYCGLLAAVTAADPIHNSTRSNRGSVADVDAEAIEYGLIAALLGDDSDVDWSISDKAECEKNGGTWVETPGLGGFCFMKIEGEPGPTLEPIEVPDVDLGDSPGWHSGSLDEIMSAEELISAPTTVDAPGEKTTGGVTYDNYEHVKNNDPIPGIDIIVDKEPEDEHPFSSDDAIEYALIVALLDDDIDWLETERFLDEFLFGGGDCNDSYRPFTPNNADTRESYDKVVRKRPGRTTYSSIVILNSADTRQSNHKVVRKRPGCSP